MRQACKNLGIDTAKKYRRASPEQIAFWQDWVGGNETPEVKTVESPNTELVVDNGILIQNIIFTAAGSLEELYGCFVTMMKTLGSKGQYQIRVEVTKAEECISHGKA